jgi:hypothetical protein
MVVQNQEICSKHLIEGKPHFDRYKALQRSAVLLSQLVSMVQPQAERGLYYTL